MESSPHIKPQPFSEQLVGQTLLKDFFWSYLLAQGSMYSIQQQTFRLLRDRYAAIWGAQALPDILAVHTSHRDVAMQFKVPTVHGTITSDGPNLPRPDTSGQFGKVWNEFGEDLASTISSNPRELGRLIIQKDASYMLDGRPGRTINDDPYSSVYRQHVLLAEPLKSENITHILAQVREEADALDEKVQRRTAKASQGLQLDWERMHPAEQFYPVDLAYLSRAKPQD